MYRKIIKDLLNWKNSPLRKPLLLSGARQTGKTYVIEKQFGKDYYKKIIKINFERDLDAQKIFENDLEPHRIIVRLENYTNTRITPEDTLIFFDEVQACPQAITSLKYFCEDAREYHIIAAGSLLGVMVNRYVGGKSFSFPVGKVDSLRMYPMDFEEFLIANNCDILRDTIEKHFAELSPLDDSLHEKALELFRAYLVIGGMPEAVKDYIDTKSFVSATSIVSRIYDDYLNDTSKYCSTSEALKNKACYESIAKQLLKENKNFKYSEVQKGKNSQYFGTSIEWLLNAGIVLKSRLVETPRYPLNVHVDEFLYRIYFSDVGLFRHKVDLPITLALDPEYKADITGLLAENYVACQLSTKGIPLLYWNGKNNSEIEFLLQEGEEIIPFEVKAGKRVTSKSLNVYKNNYKVTHVYRTSQKNFGRVDNIISIPLYSVFCINKNV